MVGALVGAFAAAHLQHPALFSEELDHIALLAFEPADSPSTKWIGTICGVHVKAVMDLVSDTTASR